MTALQAFLQSYFTSEAGLPATASLDRAVLLWQQANGFTSMDVTKNWISIAAALEVPYTGGLDMMKKFAIGEYEFPEDSESPFTDITMTAGNIGGINIGYYAGNMGSITNEPLEGFTLDRLMIAGAGSMFYLQFIGDCYD